MDATRLGNTQSSELRVFPMEPLVGKSPTILRFSQRVSMPTPSRFTCLCPQQDGEDSASGALDGRLESLVAGCENNRTTTVPSA